MGIQTFVNEFQDYLFNQIPLYGRLNLERASQTDFYGAHTNTKEILKEYETNLEFLRENSKEMEKEIDDIIEGLFKKIDKVNMYSTSIIGINSTELFNKELLTINPYDLSLFDEWEVNQKCLMLPVVSTFQEVAPYFKEEVNKKGVVKYVIPPKLSTKYINIKKKHHTQITTVRYLDDSRSNIDIVKVPSNLNKTEVLLEIPLTTKYIVVDYYGEQENLTLTPLTYKFKTHNTITLPEKIYDYGDIFAINSNIETPIGCYCIATVDISFRDINNTEIEKTSIQLPLNTDGISIKKYEEGDNVLGFWLEGVYQKVEEQSLSKDLLVEYIPEYEGVVEPFSESSIRLNKKSAKKLIVNISLDMYSLYSKSLSPKIHYFTGITKNV